MQQNYIILKNNFKQMEGGKVTAQRFLERRDDDFDTVKSFLVVSMIFAHGFQWFGDIYYDRNLTYYVIVGFVFLSGLTVGSIYQDKLLSHPFRYSWVVISRGLKLFGLFLLANAVIILLHMDKLSRAIKLRPTQLFLAALMGDHRGIFSFVILVSIGFTFIFGVFLLIWSRRDIDFLLLGIGVGALWIIQITGTDYYAVTMTLVGLTGILLAKCMRSVNWDRTKTTLSKWFLTTWACYVTYQAALLVFNDKESFLVGHYLNVTTLLLLAMYLSSHRFRLTGFRAVRFLNKSLANHMLFAYLFHLLFLNVLAIFIRRGNCNFYVTMAICLFTLVATTLGGLIVGILTSKYKTPGRLYALVFR